jgi:sensor c-di-GMP phosphodiesterase-like protein
MKHERTLEKVKIILDNKELSTKQIQFELIERGSTHVPSTNKLSQIMRGRFLKREIGHAKYLWRNKNAMDRKI